MGDRAIVQLKLGESFSPVLYTHWRGRKVASILTRAEKVMATRPNDIEYAFARLVVAAVNGNEGNTGYGVYNAGALLTEKDSPGNAGCFVVDIANGKWSVQQGGGYGLEGAHHFQVSDLAGEPA